MIKQRKVLTMVRSGSSKADNLEYNYTVFQNSSETSSLYCWVKGKDYDRKRSSIQRAAIRDYILKGFYTIISFVLGLIQYNDWDDPDSCVWWTIPLLFRARGGYGGYVLYNNNNTIYLKSNIQCI